MAFDFPSSPTVGQTFTPLAGVTYTWNGYAWDLTSGPFQPLDGDLTAIAALTGTNTIYYRSAIDTWAAVAIGANLTFSSGTLAAAAGSGFTQIVIQKFTASGTYIPTAGMKFCIVELVAGGGAGGGVTGNANAIIGAAGAGSGAYSRGVFSAATIGASQTVTIGPGGTGVSGASGNNGGASSVGSLISASGGSGGPGSATAFQGGAGGPAIGTGQVVIAGNGGLGATQLAISAGAPVNQYCAGASGGPSFFGGAGRGAYAGAGATAAGGAGDSGGGGGGAHANAVAANNAGGNGGNGLCIITEFI